jgi:hypothetical protein
MADSLLPELRDLRSAVLSLNESISQLSSEELQLQAHACDLVRLQVANREEVVLSNYRAALHHLRAVSTVLSNSASTRVRSSRHPPPEYPTVLQLRESVTNFLQGSATKQMMPHCGCFSFRVRNPRRGDFVCAEHNDAFILVTVWQVSEHFCAVFDPMDKDDSVRLIQLPHNRWTAVPTAVPQSPSARWEYRRGASVLALWPLDHQGEWTTEFYEAVVVDRPCDRAAAKTRGYALDFGDGRTHIVPEQFIVPVRTSW